jgi:hypothetical protein
MLQVQVRGREWESPERMHHTLDEGVGCCISPHASRGAQQVTCAARMAAETG